MCVSYPAVCHNIVWKDLDCLTIPYNFILTNSLDDIMLITLDEQEVANTLELSVINIHFGNGR